MSYLPITLTAIAVIILSALIGFVIRWIWSGPNKVILTPEAEEMRAEQEQSEKRLSELEDENFQLREELTRIQLTAEEEKNKQNTLSKELEQTQAAYDSLKARSDNIDKMEAQYQRDLEQSQKVLETTQARIQIIERDNRKLRHALTQIRQTAAAQYNTPDDSDVRSRGQELLSRLHSKIAVNSSQSEQEVEVNVQYSEEVSSDRDDDSTQAVNQEYTPTIIEQETDVEAVIEDSDFDILPVVQEVHGPDAVEQEIENLKHGNIVEVDDTLVNEFPDQDIHTYQEEDSIEVNDPAVDEISEDNRPASFVSETATSGETYTEASEQNIDTEPTNATEAEDSPPDLELKRPSAMDYINDQSFIASNNNRPAILMNKPDNGRADNLKRIRGVEGRLEKELNKLGLFYYAQIESLSPEDVAWIDKKLKFDGRIARDDWPVQAKKLNEKKHKNNNL